MGPGTSPEWINYDARRAYRWDGLGGRWLPEPRGRLAFARFHLDRTIGRVDIVARLAGGQNVADYMLFLTPRSRGWERAPRPYVQIPHVLASESPLFRRVAEAPPDEHPGEYLFVPAPEIVALVDDIFDQRVAWGLFGLDKPETALASFYIMPVTVDPRNRRA